MNAAHDRLRQLRTAMKQNGVDSMILVQPTDIRYISGFSGSFARMIVTRKNVYFFTNDLYEVQVKNELLPLDGLRVHITRDVWKAVSDAGIGGSATRVGFTPNNTTVSEFKAIKKAVAPAKTVEVPDIVSAITQVKTSNELASIAKAAEIASTAYIKMLGIVGAGMTEHEVATFLSHTTRSLGSERDAFDIIVVSGPRSAMPHGRATHAKLKKNTVVTVDFGCCINGLYSDMTRTFSIGTPSKSTVDVFAVLYDAHLSALDAVKAGISGADLDAAARNIITQAGYGNNFKHSLGHGLGYDVHEHPRVAQSNTTGKLKENCVITIEPGIYLPGKFGMRIEDDVIVQKKGSVILTTAPRELVIV